MVYSEYDRAVSTPEGQRLMASAELRMRAATLIHQALEASGKGKKALSKETDIPLKTINRVLDSSCNVTMTEYAEVLAALGFELVFQVVPLGEIRQARKEKRSPVPAVLPNHSNSTRY